VKKVKCSKVALVVSEIALRGLEIALFSLKIANKKVAEISTTLNTQNFT